MKNNTIGIIPLLILFCHVAGCGFDHIGREPDITPGLAPRLATPKPDIGRLAIPSPPLSRPQTAGSLWDTSGASSLFGDRRARQIGDILTVMIEIDDRAELNNKTSRSRSSGEDMSVSAALGLEDLANKILPGDLAPGAQAEAKSTNTGEGKVNRRERVELKIAAVVTDILPNGNLVIQGSQEVRVNYELRDLQISGIVRPYDISRRNTIGYEKIAEARISYGGRGNIYYAQQPRYGQQIIDNILPF